MPPKGHSAVTLPKDTYEEMKAWLEKNRESLRKIGIKKLSHIVERSWLEFKENHKGLTR